MLSISNPNPNPIPVVVYGCIGMRCDRLGQVINSHRRRGVPVSVDEVSSVVVRVRVFRVKFGSLQVRGGAAGRKGSYLLHVLATGVFVPAYRGASLHTKHLEIGFKRDVIAPVAFVDQPQMIPKSRVTRLKTHRHLNKA